MAAAVERGVRRPIFGDTEARPAEPATEGNSWCMGVPGPVGRPFGRWKGANYWQVEGAGPKLLPVLRAAARGSGRVNKFRHRLDSRFGNPLRFLEEARVFDRRNGVELAELLLFRLAHVAQLLAEGGAGEPEKE